MFKNLAATDLVAGRSRTSHRLLCNLAGTDRGPCCDLCVRWKLSVAERSQSGCNLCLTKALITRTLLLQMSRTGFVLTMLLLYIQRANSHYTFYLSFEQDIKWLQFIYCKSLFSQLELLNVLYKCLSRKPLYKSKLLGKCHSLWTRESRRHR